MFVEFTQGKLRVARDSTVNDYLCCRPNGVKCLGPYFTHSSLKNDTCDLSDYARTGEQIIHHKCYMSLISQSVDHTSHEAYFQKASLNVSYRCD